MHKHRINRPTRAHRLSRTLLALVLGLSVSTTPTQAEISLPALGDRLNIELPLSQERQIGGELLSQLSQRLPLIDDPQVLEYFHNVAQRLVNSSDRPERDVTVYINDSPEFNAMALPGGHIILNVGLLLMADTEAQMVSVLAHEIAHAHKRHGARLQQQMQQTQLVSIAATLAAILAASQNPDAARALLYSGSGFQHQRLFDYTRQHEQQADEYGQRMMAEAGFAPEGMIELFETMGQKSHSNFQAPEYLSTHPLNHSRVAKAQERAERLSVSGQPQHNSIDYTLVRARLSALSAHPNQATLPRTGQYYRSALVALNSNQLPAAKRAALALNEALPESSPQLKQLDAELLRAQGQEAKAFELLNTLQAIYPTRFSVAYQLGQWRQADGELEKAIEHLERFIRHTAKPPASAWRYAAELHGQAGNSVKALQYSAEDLRARGYHQAAVQTLHQAIDKANSAGERYRLKQRLRQWPKQ